MNELLKELTDQLAKVSTTYGQHMDIETLAVSRELLNRADKALNHSALKVFIQLSDVTHEWATTEHVEFKFSHRAIAFEAGSAIKAVTGKFVRLSFPASAHDRPWKLNGIFPE